MRFRIPVGVLLALLMATLFAFVGVPMAMAEPLAESLSSSDGPAGEAMLPVGDSIGEMPLPHEGEPMRSDSELSPQPADEEQVAPAREDITTDVSLEALSGSFPDVPNNHWAKGIINRATSLGLISGYKDGRFGPNDSITRGQVAVILWRMAGSPEGRKSFPDVPSGAYYAKAVRWAGSAGVVSGYKDGRFGPNDRITREQLAVMIANFASRRAGIVVRGNAARFINMADATSVSSYARSSMGWCFRNGVLSGTGNGYVNPKGNANRAEAAKMMVRLYEVVTKGEVPPRASDTWPYYDLYYDVVERAVRGSGEFSKNYHNADHRVWRESIEYSLYDIGGDGVPELFVRGGTSYVDLETHVFTVRDGQVVHLGAYGTGHGSMAGTVGGDLYYGGWRMGISFVQRLRHVDGSFVGTTVFTGKATSSQPDAEILGLQNYYSQHGIRGFPSSKVNSYALLSILM